MLRILAEAYRSHFERVMLCLPTGFQSDGFSVFEIEALDSSKISEKIFCTAFGIAASGNFFFAEMARYAGVVSAFDFLVNLFNISSQKSY